MRNTILSLKNNFSFSWSLSQICFKAFFMFYFSTRLTTFSDSDIKQINTLQTSSISKVSISLQEKYVKFNNKYSKTSYNIISFNFFWNFLSKTRKKIHPECWGFTVWLSNNTNTYQLFEKHKKWHLFCVPLSFHSLRDWTIRKLLSHNIFHIYT